MYCFLKRVIIIWWFNLYQNWPFIDCTPFKIYNYVGSNHFVPLYLPVLDLVFNASRTYWKKNPKLTSAKENLKRWLLIDFVFCHLKRTSFKASWLIMRKLTGVLYNLYTLTNKWVIFQTCFFNSIDVIFFYQKYF